MSTRPSNVPAIEQATGLSWEAITAALEEAGGKDLIHAALAAAAEELFAPVVDNAAWWAQSAAVAYEQQIGRRVPGQRSDGTFQVAVSKTFTGSLDEALAALEALLGDRSELDGVPFAEAPTTSATEKWRYWRVSLADGSKVSITIGSTSSRSAGAGSTGVGSGGPEKSSIGVQVSKLPDEEAVAGWRAWFKELLQGL